MELEENFLQYCYRVDASNHSHFIPDPYEKLLLDAIRGDQTFFADATEIEASWKFIDELIKARQAPVIYQPGSWGPKDADELIKIYRKVPADLINIIEYNPIDFAKYEKPEEDKVEAFIAYLGKNRVNARLRRSRGKDIDAACGQLANKESH